MHQPITAQQPKSQISDLHNMSRLWKINIFSIGTRTIGVIFGILRLWKYIKFSISNWGLWLLPSIQNYKFYTLLPCSNGILKILNTCSKLLTVMLFTEVLLLVVLLAAVLMIEVLLGVLFWAVVKLAIVLLAEVLLANWITGSSFVESGITDSSVVQECWWQK